jgi:hypothetical protein
MINLSKEEELLTNYLENLSRTQVENYDIISLLDNYIKILQKCSNKPLLINDLLKDDQYIIKFLTENTESDLKKILKVFQKRLSELKNEHLKKTKESLIFTKPNYVLWKSFDKNAFNFSDDKKFVNRKLLVYLLIIIPDLKSMTYFSQNESIWLSFESKTQILEDQILSKIITQDSIEEKISSGYMNNSETFLNMRKLNNDIKQNYMELFPKDFAKDEQKFKDFSFSEIVGLTEEQTLAIIKDYFIEKQMDKGYLCIGELEEFKNLLADLSIAMNPTQIYKNSP